MCGRIALDVSETVPGGGLGMLMTRWQHGIGFAVRRGTGRISMVGRSGDSKTLEFGCLMVFIHLMRKPAAKSM